MAFIVALPDAAEPSPSRASLKGRSFGFVRARKAITGVPHAIASIMASPKGSGQSTGNSRAALPPMARN